MVRTERAAIIQTNSLFYGLCLAWWMAAAILVTLYTREQLFFAVNGWHDGVLDFLMPMTTFLGNGWAFVIVLIGIGVLRQYRTLLIGSLVFGFSALLAQLLKHYFHTPRPLDYFQGKEVGLHMVSGVTMFRELSFPSGHTTSIFALCCFATLMTKDRRLGILFFILALLTAWSRVYLAEHFFADVYGGSVVGVFSATLVVWIASKYFPEKT